MNTFKVGDLVKRTSKGFPEYGIVEGNVYTVLDVKDSEEDEYVDICLEEDPERWYDKRNFKLYTSQPTEDLQSELEEALAKIDTLEFALEDAVKRIDNWRNGRNEGNGLKDEEYTAAIAVNQSQFKPISEYTLEDWELAIDNNWEFELRSGKVVPVDVFHPNVDVFHPNEGVYVISLNTSTQTIAGKVFDWDEEHENDVIKRVK